MAREIRHIIEVSTILFGDDVAEVALRTPAQIDQRSRLKVHKNENFFGSDFEFCTISLLVMFKY
jgi:hypothetical protein